MTVNFTPSVMGMLRPISTVSQHPQNPNNGDVDVVAESILANSFYNPVIVQESTGRIVAGNTRYNALMMLGETQIPVIGMDIDDTQALKVLIADNRTAEKAIRDQKGVEDLLLYLEENSPGGLAGTGFDEDELLELQRINRAIDHIGFGEKFEHATDEMTFNRPVIIVHGLREVNGDVSTFTHGDIDSAIIRLRELGYHVTGRSEADGE